MTTASKGPNRVEAFRKSSFGGKTAPGMHTIALGGSSRVTFESETAALLMTLKNLIAQYDDKHLIK
jgi:hypothetical protein